MGGYLLEFRLTGSARKFVKETTLRIAKLFHVRGATSHRVVPHVTVAGPFDTDDDRRLFREFDEICINYSPTTFSFNGFGSFQKFLGRDRVLKVNIEPSADLTRLRSEFVDRFSKFCKMNEYDKGRWSPHATLAFKDIDWKFERIKKYLETVEIPPIRHYMLRVTLVGAGRRIAREFDLFQRRSLNRDAALNRENQRLTLRLMQARAEGDIVGTSPAHPFKVAADARAFVISDTHFDHENIIRYCNRPFASTRLMNEALVQNWNQAVGKSDIVFFLGDFTYGRNHNSIDYWLGKLNGRVFFMRGNHDLDPVTRALEIPSCFFVRYREKDLMLTHDPLRPASWKGWMVHGDKHNNRPVEYPLVNCAGKTMNVCVEMIDYAPLPMEKALNAISRC